MPTNNIETLNSTDVEVINPRYGFWRLLVVTVVYIWSLAFFNNFLVPFVVGLGITILISFKYFEQRLVLDVHQFKVAKKALGAKPPLTKELISKVFSGMVYLLLGTLFFYVWGIALLTPSWCWIQETMGIRYVSTKICKPATSEFGAFLSHPNGNY